MDAVARLPTGDRADLFNEAAAKRGLELAIIEKDFWVCWTLKRLFALPVGAHLVFKGGTSLSKVFGVIERFSEDIDLSFDRRALGFGDDNDPATAPSRKQAQQRIKDLVEAVQQHIATDLVPALTAAVTTELGPAGKVWALTIDRDYVQTVLFTYPSSIASSSAAYIPPVVRLELGARGDVWPTVDGTLRPYAAEEFPEHFKQPTCQVRTLAVERTFWEKATILHAEYHRPADKDLGHRQSRHYYDLVRLADSAHGRRSLDQIELLDRVVEHKKLFFASAWAHYDTAVAGTLRLCPPSESVAELRADYAKMQPMFFQPPPTFEAILERLKQLEDQINATAVR